VRELLVPRDQLLPHEAKVRINGRVPRRLKPHFVVEMPRERGGMKGGLVEARPRLGEGLGRVLEFHFDFDCFRDRGAVAQKDVKAGFKIENVEDLWARVLTERERTEVRAIEHFQFLAVLGRMQFPNRESADWIAFEMKDSQISQLGERFKVIDVLKAVVVHEEFGEKLELTNVAEARYRVVGEIERKAIRFVLWQNIDALDIVSCCT
jgi:hypothetical protein